MTLSFSITGDKELAAKLARIPASVKGDVEMAVANYMLKVLTNDEVPPENHSITRAQAYPDLIAISPLGKSIVGYRSWKQFKYVQMLRAQGKIPYHRRGKKSGISSQWRIIQSGDQLYITNPAEGAVFLYDNERQARFSALVGWPKIKDVIARRSSNIRAVISRAVKTGLKKAGINVDFGGLSPVE
jgi:hypothetical protein